MGMYVDFMNFMMGFKQRKRGYVYTLARINGIHNCTGISFSQNCEDLFVMSLIGNKKEGFYVDIGAHDPIKYSNTFLLYLNGWNGINIVPLPECKKRFDQYRAGDINLNIGISDVVGEMEYYKFLQPAYNTFSKEMARERINNNTSTLIESMSVPVATLSQVFSEHLNNRIIDFMNLDVESMELEVLRSNDWDRFRPHVIAMESLQSCERGIDDVNYDDAVSFLLDKGYVVIGKIKNEVFLIDEKETDI